MTNFDIWSRKWVKFVQGTVDILIVTETKFDSTFPTSPFVIDGYSEPYRFDRNKNGGGVFIYIWEDIPRKPLADHKLTHDIEGIFVELNLRKKKWLLFGSYHPLANQMSISFIKLKKGLICTANFMKDICWWENLMQRSQNLIFSNFSLKWMQKILLRSLPVIKV